MDHQVIHQPLWRRTIGLVDENTSKQEFMWLERRYRPLFFKGITLWTTNRLQLKNVGWKTSVGAISLRIC